MIGFPFIWWKILFFTVAVLDGIVAVGCLRRRQIHSAGICRACLAAMATTVFYTGAISSEDYFVSSLFSSLYFIGVDFILLFMLQFVVNFCELKLSPPVRRAVSVTQGAAMVDALVLLCNPFWEIAIGYIPFDLNGHIIYKYDTRFLYECHLVLCYLLVAAIVGILLFRILRTPKIYVGKYRLVLLVFVFDVFLNVLYLLGSEYFELDVSVLFYSLSAFLIYSAVFSSIPRTLLAATRNYFMENMDAQVIVFDYEDRVIDSNQSARKLFPELTPERQNTVDAVDVPQYFRDKGFPEFDGTKQQFEWNSHRGGEERRYLCRRHDFLDEKNRPIGRMLMMHDVSYQKDSVTGLDMTPGLYRYISNLNKEVNYPIQILTVNVNGLGLINSALGHNKGNMVMARTAEIMRDVVGKGVYMAKLEDGTLVAMLLKTTGKRAVEMGREIRSLIRKETSMGFNFDSEYGISEVNELRSDIFEALRETERSLKNRKLLSGNSHESPIINSLTQTLLESDYETEAHVKRTKRASQMIAGPLGLTDRDTSALELLCMLHDVGKVGIPTEILLKPGKLNADEWEIMKTHADKGYRIAMASPELQSIAVMILHHHERWDGTGYPGRLKGEEIPLLSRVITVLDSFDVMTHDRPYHKAIPLADAKAELLRCSGTQFDPHVVESFLTIADRVYYDAEEGEEASGIR